MLIRKLSAAHRLISQTVDSISARYLDPKNAKKGDHRVVCPSTIYGWIKDESLEASQAYENNEGLEREKEELGDVMLLCAMRMDQILEEEQWG